MTKGKLFYILIILFCFSLILSCSEKSPTESVDTAQLTGYVYQSVNGFFNYISDADITVGTYHTVSDSIGRYSIEIPLGEYTIQTSHELFEITTDTIRVRGDRSYLIHLLNGPVYSITGVVTDTSGAVIAGAVVELEHLKDTTDINGIYSFSDILSGSRVLSCNYMDYYFFVDTLEVRSTDISKDINLIRQGYNISGTVSHPVDGLLSGVEVILDDSLYDTTNMNGEYLFENIYIGDHQLQVNSAIYDNQVIEFSLGKVDLISNFELVKTIFYVQTVDTLWIEKDAMVKKHEYLDYSVYTTTNYGEDSTLELYRDYINYYSNIDGQIYRNEVTRIFMELPNIVDLQADSIFLVLSFNQYSYYSAQFSIIFSGILTPWNELTINWDNQPIPDSTFIFIEQNFQTTNRLKVNITDFVSLMNSTNGLRISIQNEICNVCWAGVWFCSSEYDLIEKRPHLIIYKTEPLL